MRRGLVHAMAWTLATGAAVTLSWWGVHTVMSGTAYDRPLAVPLTTQPLSSSTYRADPSPRSSSPEPSGTPSSASAAPSQSPAASSAQPSSKPSAGASPGRRGGGGESGNVKSYTVAGGLVVFDLGASSAELVSATPAAGWRMQVWKQDVWIRVTFTRDGREVSVFCTWHDHPPAVEVWNG
ncbi:hypothetical protein [Streptomyces sp. NPDC051183]|uniref:hypothetical protein n=1 Tax=unclassified Streptomyces TaxID=2593676 RepID=UPI00343BF090